MTRAIVARAPTRLDLAGGWTDVPPYPEREGGAVCAIAITRYATATAALDDRMARAAGKSSVDTPIKKDRAIAQFELTGPARISVACGVVSGNELSVGGGQ